MIYLAFSKLFTLFVFGPGLQDIEQLGVDIAGGQAFANILTMRYNFTEHVVFNLKVCEGHGVYDGSSCQLLKERRSFARTVSPRRSLT